MSDRKSAMIQILGCGTSTGVPIPGCECSVCLSDNPKNERLRTSAALSFGENLSVLIDATPDLRMQALRHSLTSIDAVLFTHAHADHILGTDDLRVFNFKKKSPIPCYGSSETLSSIQRVFHYIFNRDLSYQGGAIAQLDCREIRALKPFKINEQLITPFTVHHGKMPVMGFRVGGLVYATDCNQIPDESREIMMDAEVLFIDGLREEPHGTHFSISEAVDAATRLRAKQTYLIHMTHTVEYESTNKGLPENIQLAYDGMKVEFPL